MVNSFRFIHIFHKVSAAPIIVDILLLCHTEYMYFAGCLLFHFAFRYFSFSCLFSNYVWIWQFLFQREFGVGRLAIMDDLLLLPDPTLLCWARWQLSGRVFQWIRIKSSAFRIDSIESYWFLFLVVLPFWQQVTSKWFPENNAKRNYRLVYFSRVGQKHILSYSYL